MDSFTASDGLHLGYCVDDFTDPWKKAPILLLLHAAMGSARRYYAWVPPLCRHYRVVRMDLRGHGSSEVPPADRELTLERLVRDVIELMDHLGCAERPYRRQFGRRLSRPAIGDEPCRAGAQPDAVRLDPGPQEQPGAELDPADCRRKGMRAFLAETIADRLAARPGRSGPRRVVSRRGGKERSGLYRQIRAADGELRLERRARIASTARPSSSCRAPSRSARPRITSRSAGLSGMSRCGSMTARRTISATPSPTAAPAMCSIFLPAASGSVSDGIESVSVRA